MEAPTFLEGLYKHYTEGAEDMDGGQFFRLIKDCNLMEKKLSKADIGSIFIKSVEAGTRTINFDKFKQNFSQIAMRKSTSKNEIVRKMEAKGKSLMRSYPASGLSYSFFPRMSEVQPATMSDVSTPKRPNFDDKMMMTVRSEMQSPSDIPAIKKIAMQNNKDARFFK